MKQGDWINTPRFLKVKIEKVFNSEREAKEQGFYEPTHYDNTEWEICGKHIGINRMIFAAVKKER